MKYTNKCKLPKPIYDALTFDSYYHDGVISATGLINSPRQYQLIKRHYSEIIKDAIDNFWSLMGSIGHNIIEKEKVGEGLKEERLYMDILGWKIAGKFDLWLSPGSLEDYKFTSVWVYIMDKEKKEWEEQLNIYAYMMIDAGFPVKNLFINAFFRDWIRSRAKYDKKYPQVPYKRYKLKLWSIDKQKKYIEGRVALHQAHENTPDNELPECTELERWQTETKYAVMKKGNKKACRGGLKNSMEEAEKYIKNHKDSIRMYVEIRRGEARKCADYCDAAPFCNQYQKMCDG